MKTHTAMRTCPCPGAEAFWDSVQQQLTLSFSTCTKGRVMEKGYSLHPWPHQINSSLPYLNIGLFFQRATTKPSMM